MYISRGYFDFVVSGNFGPFEHIILLLKMCIFAGIFDVTIFQELYSFIQLLYGLFKPAHFFLNLADHCVIMGHKDDVQSLANKIRTMLLSSMSETSHGSQRSGRRWMGPRSRKGTEDYWKEVLRNSTTPLYWREFRGGHEIQHFLQTEENHCRVNPVDKETFKAISDLVEQTWTLDVVGKGADARNLSHQRIRIKKIERVESIELFSHYSNERDGIIRKMLRSGLTSYPRLDTITTKGGLLTTLKMPKLLNTSLYLDVNEHYAFHGTKSSYVENIVRKGIDPRKATEKLLFGQGIYCAESSTKADQYAGIIF